MTILEQINAKEARMNEIAAEIETAENVEQIGTLTTEYGQLEEERSALQKALAAKPVKITDVSNFNQRSASGLNGEDDLDPRGTKEYRKAFMAYVRNGGAVPAELRADATTTTTDVSALVPTTIMNRVIEELETYGNVFQRITRSNVKGGVRIAISSLKPEASWVGEGAVSEKKKLQADSYVSFGYYKLQVRIATSLEASVATLDAFEQMIARAITRAIIKAVESAVFNGSGVGQPTGILTDTRIVAGQKFTFVAGDATYDGWMKKFISKIKNAYATQPGNAIYCNKATFDSYMAGMVDANGQPVARVTMGIAGKQERTFMGYPVEVVDYLPSLDLAGAATVFLVFGDLSEWILNSNLQLTYRKYYDENTDEWIEKSTLIADGKVADAAGFVFLKTA
jgi:HK97 family phage major capsid protein